MIKIFETAKIKDLDEYTIRHEPISSIDLVERAATAFAQEFCRNFPKQNRVIVFSGQGNNGADALAIARMLSDEDFRVEVYLLNPIKRLSADCEINKQRLLSDSNVRLTEVVEDFTPPVLNDRDIVIDGLFGSGLNRPLTGGYAAVVEYINNSEATVVSIDIPSGLFGEDNRSNNPQSIIRADYTYTFEFPKLAFLLPENAAYVGKWKILPIGIHPDGIDKEQAYCKMITDTDFVGLLKPRDKFAHKGMFGHALLVAGSRGKVGAAVLAAKACLRSGVGLLTVHVPQCGETTLQTSVPEAMLSLDSLDDHVSVLPDITSYEAIAVGPGLGTHAQSVHLLKELLDKAGEPLLIDADALNILAAHPELIPLLPPFSILTPHPKEFDRLFGDCECGFERLRKARTKAMELTVCIVLKGAYTALCTPEGNIYINSTGNPGMATAGSGDTLTGVILGLLAQHYEPETAAVAGVYLHGLAGDLAADHASEESLIASDIIRQLGKAFRLQKDEN
ncbi:MAG: NAD(P)H-hydrate dehydratase [Tannerella sp.]|jgi:NAD(P)H-hydrate epimerase|nr:NAD(P)H-hydrate dehydratase [Tannerella sp.]